ncbi:hypothetical protein MUGA111182_04780 [Mucilaginibacter galii]
MMFIKFNSLTKGNRIFVAAGADALFLYFCIHGRNQYQ